MYTSGGDTVRCMVQVLGKSLNEAGYQPPVLGVQRLPHTRINGYCDVMFYL